MGDKTYSVVTKSKATLGIKRNQPVSTCRKYAKWGVHNNEGTRDRLAKKVRGKEEAAAAKLKPPARNVPTEPSAPGKLISPAKSQLPPTRFSGAYTVIMPPTRF
ncbi:hypothetical protein VE03_07909 [Pseudogymnoascus sp. 23342-1-I1]|nr:hypothetical protein VE03_07909 [Pseudogymnoascus sp. 23342-1-I1]